MTKAELRKQMKAAVAGLDPVSRSFESMSKSVAVIQSEIFKRSKVIFGFMPMKDEVDVLPVLRAGIQQGKKVFIPKITEGTNDMVFYRLTDEPNAQTEAGAYGIYEPKEELEKCSLDGLLAEVKADEILVLVPGLAFGKDNGRLGRGMGFYDRFLSGLKNKAAALGKSKPWICGLCYGVQLLDSVPTEENDILMDVVL